MSRSHDHHDSCDDLCHPRGEQSDPRHRLPRKHDFGKPSADELRPRKHELRQRNVSVMKPTSLSTDLKLDRGQWIQQVQLDGHNVVWDGYKKTMTNARTFQIVTPPPTWADNAPKDCILIGELFYASPHAEVRTSTQFLGIKSALNKVWLNTLSVNEWIDHVKLYAYDIISHASNIEDHTFDSRQRILKYVIEQYDSAFVLLLPCYTVSGTSFSSIQDELELFRSRGAKGVIFKRLGANTAYHRGEESPTWACYSFYKDIDGEVTSNTKSHGCHVRIAGGKNIEVPLCKGRFAQVERYDKVKVRIQADNANGARLTRSENACIVDADDTKYGRDNKSEAHLERKLDTFGVYDPPPVQTGKSGTIMDVFSGRSAKVEKEEDETLPRLDSHGDILRRDYEEHQTHEEQEADIKRKLAAARRQGDIDAAAEKAERAASNANMNGGQRTATRSTRSNNDGTQLTGIPYTGTSNGEPKKKSSHATKTNSKQTAVDKRRGDRWKDNHPTAATITAVGGAVVGVGALAGAIIGLTEVGLHLYRKLYTLKARVNQSTSDENAKLAVSVEAQSKWTKDRAADAKKMEKLTADANDMFDATAAGYLIANATALATSKIGYQAIMPALYNVTSVLQLTQEIVADTTSVYHARYGPVVRGAAALGYEVTEADGTFSTPKLAAFALITIGTLAATYAAYKQYHAVEDDVIQDAVKNVETSLPPAKDEGSRDLRQHSKVGNKAEDDARKLNDLLIANLNNATMAARSILYSTMQNNRQ